MKKRMGGEPCPYCPSRATTEKSDTVAINNPEEMYRGEHIVKLRMQHRRCPNCGARGHTMIFIGETRWEDKENSSAALDNARATSIDA